MVTLKRAQPPIWTEKQIEDGRATALQRFIDAAGGRTAYPKKFKECLEQVEALFEATDDLLDFTGDKFATDSTLVAAARFLGGPPISEDDLETLVSASVGKRLFPEVAARVAEVLKAAWDPMRFLWLDTGRKPSPQGRQAAMNWTAGIWAVERVRTDLRNQRSKDQQDAVAAALTAYGYVDMPRPTGRHISSLDDVPRGKFMRNAWLAGKDCDVAVRLHDGRLLAIECKVSNSSVNSIKRLINDAGGKADIWAKVYGAQVIPAAVLSGVFRLVNLVEAQAKHNVFIIWEHDLAPLKRFLNATAGR